MAVTPHHKSIATLQNINSPDFDLERDAVNPALLLGMENSELAADKRYQINLSTIFISALIFLAILAWFDFIQTTIFVWLSPEVAIDTVPPAVKLWYAIFITIMITILVVLIYYHFGDYVK